LPVDALLLKFDGATLKIDESSVTGESDLIVKCTIFAVAEGKGSHDSDHLQSAVLVSGSIVNEGTA